jgi:hypothetical protein
MTARRRPRPIVGNAPADDPMAPSDYVIRAILDGLDQVARDMEREWGVDRLRLLVSDHLRARFDAQKDKLDAAVVANEERYVRAQAEGMKRAWAALNKAAIEAGARPLSPEVWECKLPSSGAVVAIVRSSAEARHVAGERLVFSLEEIARLIDDLPAAVLETKRVFPGAEVARVGPPEIDWERGDDIPF